MSFHGCVFSIIYEKNYYVFKRFSDQDKMSTNTRVTNLLDRLRLNDRLVKQYEELNLNVIDYESVNYRVQQFRDESRTFLINALMEGER